MPAGIQIFDSGGNITLDVNDTTAKYLGQLEVGASGSGGQSGTITNGGFSQGALWWLSTLPATNAYAQSITISVSGNTMTWTAGANTPAFTLFYGIV